MARSGGRRRGAGRPPLPEGAAFQKVSVSLPAALLAYARRIGGTTSQGMRTALEFHRTKAKKPTR